MKTLEFYSTGYTITALKPLLDKLAEVLGEGWTYEFNGDSSTARYTHGVMFFEIHATNGNTMLTIKCGNDKIAYDQALSRVWGGASNCYYCADILETEDRSSIVIGFRSGNDNPTYGFNLIWGKYDDGSEFLIRGTADPTNSSSINRAAHLLDDTATASRTFSLPFSSADAPMCFGKIPKSNFPILSKSLYTALSVPAPVRYTELLQGDKKFAGVMLCASKAANSTPAYLCSAFAIPVKSFEIEHITV